MTPAARHRGVLCALVATIAALVPAAPVHATTPAPSLRDVIGFDPRVTGRTAPADCGSMGGLFARCSSPGSPGTKSASGWDPQPVVTGIEASACAYWHHTPAHGTRLGSPDAPPVLLTASEHEPVTGRRSGRARG